MEKGVHLLLDWYGCDVAVVNDAQKLETVLLEAAHIAGCTILHSFAHQFAPQGATAIVVLAESHFSAHSAPEHDYISLDIYTCVPSMMPDKALDYLKEKLKPQRDKTRRMKRY